MVNGYGLFLIAWLFAGFIYKCYNARDEVHPISSIAAWTFRFVAMVWLIFQI
jgi:hypothetical protein